MKTIKDEELTPDAKRFLDSLDVSEEELVYEQDGEPRLIIVSPRFLEQRRRAKEQLFTLIDRVRERNENLDSDQVLADLNCLDDQERPR